LEWRSKSESASEGNQHEDLCTSLSRLTVFRLIWNPFLADCFGPKIRTSVLNRANMAQGLLQYSVSVSHVFFLYDTGHGSDSDRISRIVRARTSCGRLQFFSPDGGLTMVAQGLGPMGIWSAASREAVSARESTVHERRPPGRSGCPPRRPRCRPHKMSSHSRDRPCRARCCTRPSSEGWWDR